MKDKVRVENVATLYEASKFSHVAEQTFRFIERFFTVVVKTTGFLQLDFARVSKILASSSLNVSSELEVFHAAEQWVAYNTEERNQHARDIFFKIRFPLLSDDALKNVLRKNYSFKYVRSCLVEINNILKDKTNYFESKSKYYFTHRYCNQNSFSVLICGGHGSKDEYYGKIHQTDGENFESSRLLCETFTKRDYAKPVCSDGDVYIFGGIDPDINPRGGVSRFITSVDKFSPFTHTYEEVDSLEELANVWCDYEDYVEYCVCALMGKIYLIGGYDGETITNQCIEYDPKDNAWGEVASMREKRERPSGAVFEGTIIVTGGLNYVDEYVDEVDAENMNDLEDYDDENDAVEDEMGGGIDYYFGNDSDIRPLRTVESYDPTCDRWTDLPKMIYRRYKHHSVAVRNKLFVIGGGRTSTCEVYDSTCTKFIALKPPPITNRVHLIRPIAAVMIGTKFVVFNKKTSKLLCYDVESNKWSVKYCELLQDLEKFSCVKMPQLTCSMQTI